MQNMVPLGTGNSRFMKSNIPASTTLQQLIQMLNNGTFPYDVGAVNPAGVSQQGTPLNKATLLQDATAALYGLGSDAVPSDVFEKLAGAAFNTGGSVTDVNGNPLGVQIATGSYVGTGKYGSSNPNSLTFEFEPKLVIVNYSGFAIFVRGSTKTIVAVSASNYPFKENAVSWGVNKVSWYHTGTSESQLNKSGITYFYVAIG